jgi:hypothetical protein
VKRDVPPGEGHSCSLGSLCSLLRWPRMSNHRVIQRVEWRHIQWDGTCDITNSGLTTIKLFLSIYRDSRCSSKIKKLSSHMLLFQLYSLFFWLLFIFFGIHFIIFFNFIPYHLVLFDFYIKYGSHSFDFYFF